MPDNPVGHLSKLNEETDVRIERRPLSAEEFTWLIDMTKGCREIFRKLNGGSRRCCTSWPRTRAEGLRTRQPHASLVDARRRSAFRNRASRLLETSAEGYAAHAEVAGGSVGRLARFTRP